MPLGTQPVCSVHRRTHVCHARTERTGRCLWVLSCLRQFRAQILPPAAQLEPLPGSVKSGAPLQTNSRTPRHVDPDFKRFSLVATTCHSIWRFPFRTHSAFRDVLHTVDILLHLKRPRFVQLLRSICIEPEPRFRNPHVGASSLRSPVPPFGRASLTNPNPES